MTLIYPLDFDHLVAAITSQTTQLTMRNTEKQIQIHSASQFPEEGLMTFSKMSTTFTDMCGFGNGWIIQRFKNHFEFKKND